MPYLIAIFLLGLMVTAIVAKGVLQANEFAKEELERHLAETQGSRPKN